jgi:NAD(P)H-dependent FMN reductase
MNEQVKPTVGVIIGSNRTARMGGSITEWALKLLQRPEYNLRVLDLADINLPFLDEPDLPAHGHYQNESTIAFAEMVATCDAFVFVFPQYNWGYPAVLKNALDTVFKEWNGKPVGTIIYGGHTMQAEVAIRLVIAGLRMPQLATNVSLILTDTTTRETVARDFVNDAPSIRAMGAELAQRLRQSQGN